MSQPTSSKIQSISECIESASEGDLSELDTIEELINMPKEREVEGEDTAKQMAAVEDLLNDLPIEDETRDEVLETIEEDLKDNEEDAGMDEDEAASLRTLEAKDEAYSEQKAGGEVDPEAAKAAASAKKGRAKSAAGTGTKRPRAERDLNALPDEAFVLYKDDEANEATKKATLGMMPKQKKVAEKFQNFLASIHANKRPSTYIVQLFTALAERKEVTSAELVGVLRANTSNKGSTYDEGTARSQVGQIMTLFPVLGLAIREKNKLTFNKDSAIAPKLQKIIKDTAA